MFQLVWIGKQQMVSEITAALQRVGYGVTQKAVSDAYPRKRGSQLLYGVWCRVEVAPQWAVQKLESRGVRFTHKPSFEVPPPDPSDPFNQLSRTPPHRWQTFLEHSLPNGDRD